MDSVGITLNKNMIADDSRPPMDPSGIRLGTPAITTRGFEENESKQIAEIIVEVLKNPEDGEVLEKAKKQVLELIERFPVPEKFK